jgi:hypothetical protein
VTIAAAAMLALAYRNVDRGTHFLSARRGAASGAKGE